MADTKALTIAELIQVCKDCKERLPREECMIHVDDIARTLQDVQDTIDKDSDHQQRALIEAEEKSDSWQAQAMEALDQLDEVTELLNKTRTSRNEYRTMANRLANSGLGNDPLNLVHQGHQPTEITNPVLDAWIAREIRRASNEGVESTPVLEILFRERTRRITGGGHWTTETMQQADQDQRELDTLNLSWPR